MSLAPREYGIPATRLRSLGRAETGSGEFGLTRGPPRRVSVPRPRGELGAGGGHAAAPR